MQFSKLRSIDILATMRSRPSPFFVKLGITLLFVVGVVACRILGPDRFPYFLIPLRCPLNFLLGIACPTCGLGHSIVHAIAGEWRQSVEHHILGIPFLVLATLVLLTMWIRVFYNRHPASFYFPQHNWGLHLEKIFFLSSTSRTPSSS